MQIIALLLDNDKNSLGPQPHNSAKCQLLEFWPYKADDNWYGLSCVLACHPALFESGVKRVPNPIKQTGQYVNGGKEL